MKTFTFLLLSMLFLFGCSPNLENLVKNQQFDKILEMRKSMKYDWSDGWNLDSCSNGEIDHCVYGSILHWSKVTDSCRYFRYESYTRDGKYYSFSEQKFIGDFIKTNTSIRFRKERTLYFKKEAIYTNSSKSLDRYFLLHLYESDSSISTYKTSSYHVGLIRGRFDFAIEKLPNDIELISGKDILFELR